MSAVTWKMVYQSIDGLAVEEVEQRPKDWGPPPTMCRQFQSQLSASYSLADVPQVQPNNYRIYRLTHVYGSYAFYNEKWSG